MTAAPEPSASSRYGVRGSNPGTRVCRQAIGSALARFAMAGLLAALMLPGKMAGAAVIRFDDNSLPTGDNPQSFSVSDCNNDDLPDIASANFDANTADVFLNDGSGTLLHHGTATAASKPGGAACGDFNGDGIVDVAVSSWTDGTVRAYLGDGNGGFTPTGAAIDVGRNPRSVWAADLNLDNHLDLVVAISLTSDVALLFGDGAGAFPIVGRYNVAQDDLSHVTAATVADFNNDGFQDVAVSSDGSPSLSFLLGPDFHLSTGPLPSPGKLRGVAAGNINNDVFPDLALLTEDSRLLLYTGTNTGAFTLHSTLPVQSKSVAVALADFNSDSFTDIGLSYSDANSIQIVKATGHGQFPSCGVDGSPLFCPPKLPVELPVQLTSRGFRRGPSGQPQLVFLHKGTRSLSLIDVGSGSPMSTLQPLTDPPEQLLLADVDHDGILDAVVTVLAKRARNIQVLRGNAAGGYDAPPSGPSVCGNGILEGAESCDDANVKGKDGCSATCSIETKRGWVFLDAADFTGDGNQDLVLVDGSGIVRLLVSNGQRQFESIRTLGKARRKTVAVQGDFNGDLKLDLAFIPAKSKSGAVSLMLNDGTGQFVATPVLYPGGRLTAPLVAGDLNKDGVTDLLVGRKSKPLGLTAFYGATLAPLSLTHTASAPSKDALDLQLGDLVEDGWPDVVARFQRKPPLLLNGSSSGDFSSSVVSAAGNSPSLTIADVNDDQHQDLVSCNLASVPSCAMLYGDGAGNFTSAAGPPIPPGTTIGLDVRGAAAADFDGDGVVDLAGLSRENNTLTIQFRGGTRSSLVLPTGTAPSALDVSDVDGDQRPDLIAVTDGSLSLNIYRNLGGRLFGQAEIKLPITPPIGPSTFTSMVVADANGDGMDDIAVTQAASAKVTLVLNNGHGGFGATAHLPTGPEPRGVAIGKFNDDDVFDLATANRANDTISVFLSAPDGSFIRTDISSAGIRPWDVKAPDLNSDGFADLVVLNESSAVGSSESSLVTFLNDGAGTFTSTQTHVRGRDFATKMCVGDFDGDFQEDDIAVASILSLDVMVLHGGGDGIWSGDERDYPVADPIGGISCYDADNDGRSDIAFGRRTAGDVGVILTGP